jgi:hypothetical protein
MALTPCIECGHEISKEAKTCPNCGAKNRAYKSKAVRYSLIVAVLGVVVFLAYVYLSYGDYVTNCDTPSKREAFASVINGSSYTQLNKLRVIDITNIKTVKSGDKITALVCEATINFNSLGQEKYRFTWRESESGALLIQAQEKVSK